MTTQAPTEFGGVPVARMEAAFVRMEGFLLALPKAQLRRVNTDVMRGAQLVLAKLPEILALRPELAALPRFDLSHCDRLEDLALCLMHVEGLRLAEEQGKAPLKEVHAAAVALRRQLVWHMKPLILQGDISGAPLRALKGPTGYDSCGRDLNLLSTVIERDWAAFEGRSAVRREDLVRAQALALRLLTEPMRLEHQKPSRGKMRVLRQRAFTRLFDAYEAVRRGVLCCRGGVTAERDSIAPPMHAYPRGKPAKAEETGESALEAVPSRSAEAPAAEPAPEASAEPAPNLDSTPGFGSRAIPVGLPGSSPFL